MKPLLPGVLATMQGGVVEGPGENSSGSSQALFPIPSRVTDDLPAWDASLDTNYSRALEEGA